MITRGNKTNAASANNVPADIANQAVTGELAVAAIDVEDVPKSQSSLGSLSEHQKALQVLGLPLTVTPEELQRGVQEVTGGPTDYQATRRLSLTALTAWSPMATLVKLRPR